MGEARPERRVPSASIRGAGRAVAILDDSCLTDLDRDGGGGDDVVALLTAWGSGGGNFDADINNDGNVDGRDLGILLVKCGECPAN